LTLYRAKTRYIEATQWYNITDIVGSTLFEGSQFGDVCPNCSNYMNTHGVYNNGLICPGSYFLSNGVLMSKENFEKQFETIVVNGVDCSVKCLEGL
jgi:hypothetical protein